MCFIFWIIKMRACALFGRLTRPRIRSSVYGQLQWRSIAHNLPFCCGDVAAEWRPVLAEQETKSRIPVLIVGAGPVGLSLSILLSKYGIRSMLVERKLELSQHPQAHVINNRTMEIFRKMEGLEKEIQDWQPPLDEWRKFVYCSTLSGRMLGIVDHLQPQDTLERRSPTSIAHFSQHRLLPLLFKRARKLSLSLKHHANNIDNNGKVEDILLGHKLVSLETNPNGVRATISSSAAGSNVLRGFTCSYLVATDGAGSSVRGLMGVGMRGEAELQHLISVHFLSKDLGQYLLINQPAMLYFVFNTRLLAVIVAHNLQTGEFVAQIPYYPPHQVLEDFTKEVCRELICDAAGIKELMMEVKTVKQWVMNAEVADTFICGHGRVILAGDAAHRFPPAGGFGMNTGIQDVHNLAWKLAAILNGSVSPDLLFTYEVERQSIAKANSALSVANFRAAMAIPVALGLDPSAARMAQQIVSSGASWLPNRFQSAILNGVFTIGRLQVSPVLLNTFASTRIAQVRQILQQGRSLQLHFPAEDLGFRYASGAIFEKSDANDLGNRETIRERQEYVPSTRPGYRLPHCFITLLSHHNHVSEKAMFSTLDLTSSDQLRFLIIIGPGRNGCCWADAALHARNLCTMPFMVTVLWPKGSAERLWLSVQSTQDPGSGLTEEESYLVYEWGYENRNYVVHVEDCRGLWWELCREPLMQAMFVRPDDHIAWQTTQEANSGASSEVEKVLKFISRAGDTCDVP